MTSSVIFSTKISSTSTIENSGQLLTSSEMLSNEIRSTSTIETSGQLLTSSEILSNEIRSTSTIETTGQPMTISEMMYITEVSGILFSYEVIYILSSFFYSDYKFSNLSYSFISYKYFIINIFVCCYFFFHSSYIDKQKWVSNNHYVGFLFTFHSWRRKFKDYKLCFSHWSCGICDSFTNNCIN